LSVGSPESRVRRTYAEFLCACRNGRTVLLWCGCALAFRIRAEIENAETDLENGKARALVDSDARRDSARAIGDGVIFVQGAFTEGEHGEVGISTPNDSVFGRIHQ
jgi:hypothetical protein